VALASEPIGQDRAYFEFKVARDGDWSVCISEQVYLTESADEDVLQKSIPAQIRQLILFYY
jgi:hypothetical protein